MLVFYLVASAALIPFFDIFFNVLRESYSWWLVPLMYLGFVLAFIIIHLAILGISISLININSSQDKHSGYFRKLVDLTLPLLFSLCRVHIDITGEDKIPEDRRFLLVCNHLHLLDPAVLLRALPRAELGFIGKKEIYTTMPFIAKAMHKLHCLPIDRENNREAVKTIIKAAKYISDDVISVGLFPEGYTSKDGNLQPMRNGAFKIAYKAHAPIVVCTLNDTRDIVKNMFRRKTVIHLDVLEVLYPEQFESLSTAEVGENIYDMMLKNVQYRRGEKTE